MSQAAFEETRLWQQGLAATQGDQNEEAKEALRASFRSFRGSAATVAGEIARDLPDFTVHDITHLDALWSIAGEIAGPDIQLTPAETFVLGGAFLVHDLGMAIASYPGGVSKLQERPDWRSALTAILRRETGDNPSAEDLREPPEEARREATEAVLRRLHARRAEKLVVEPIGWEENEKGEKTPRFLLDETEMRNAFGRVIGRIAHSHWWPVERLPKEFASELNAPAGFPADWTIDPLRLACLLRVADASHLDRLRAPSLLRLLRNPPGIAHDHWVFQGALDPPRCDGDRIRFTANRAFPPEDAEAWWLCLDALRLADRELNHVDALLADLKLPRFAARGVIGVDAPERLTDFVPTEGWVPVEAKIEVSDVAQIIERLGGDKLYGDQLAVPLRELIQNAADATALRAGLGGERAPIRVIHTGLSDEDEGHGEVLEVVDNGVGMSSRVLTGALLDFGVSLWGSDALFDEFPDLGEGTFKPTGIFGIGFFSVFMWSEKITVISRRYDAGMAETHVLEFSHGLGGRPILRVADDHEQRAEPGTTVRLELKDDLHELVDWRYGNDLARLCGRIAPALSATLSVETEGEEPVSVLAASDWIEMPGFDLLMRLYGEERDERDEGLGMKVAENLRPVAFDDGSTAGRLALFPGSGGRLGEASALVVGGLRADDLRHFAGILWGVQPNAARNEAKCSVSHEEMARWASEQAELVAGLSSDPLDRILAADIIGQLGGDTGQLPICETAAGFLPFDELRDWVAGRDHAVVVDLSIWDAEYYEFAGSSETLSPADDVVVIHVSGLNVPTVLQPPRHWEVPGAPVHGHGVISLVDRALAMGWGLDPEAEIYGDDMLAEERIFNQPRRVIGTVEGREVAIHFYQLAEAQLGRASGRRSEQE